MPKNNRMEGGVKGTGLVKALGRGLLDYEVPAWLLVVSHLGCHGGDVHASNHTAWYQTVGLPERTYYRVLGQLEADEVIEICTDERCPHRIWGELGWRLTLRFTRWLDRPDSPWQSATGGRESLPLMAVVVTPDLASDLGLPSHTSEQEDKRGLLTQPGPAGPGRGSMKNQPEEWLSGIGADIDKPPPRKGRSPAMRVRLAFEAMAASKKEYWGIPVTNDVARMMSNIKWMLTHNVDEDTIIESFAWLGSVTRNQGFGGAALWDVYFRNRQKLIEQTVKGRAGRRPGGRVMTAGEIAQEKRR